MIFENTDFISPEEEMLLSELRPYLDKLPSTRIYVAHPTNYPRAIKTINQILAEIHKDSPEAEHSVAFDELIGSGMCLTIKSWSFSFYGCQNIAKVIALADTFDIEATLDGKVRLHFGFRNTRVPFFQKDK